MKFKTFYSKSVIQFPFQFYGFGNFMLNKILIFKKKTDLAV